MNGERQNPWESWGCGIFIPLLGCLFALYHLCYVRREKGGAPMTDEDAFWYSVPVIGLSLFFHGKYFGFYRAHRWLRWLILVTAVGAIGAGLFGGFAPRIRRLL